MSGLYGINFGGSVFSCVVVFSFHQMRAKDLTLKLRQQLSHRLWMNTGYWKFLAALLHDNFPASSGLVFNIHLKIIKPGQ